ncbi:MAG: ATP-binding cassette domain-containing protein [Lachnospiraceae bacterium]|nr:ATP-binding cassette domain-containing protein [Lachnospiraceae bacterium]
MSKILEVNHLKKYFNVSQGVLHAVDDVSFSIDKGETLGIVGESGCGKSTLGRTLLNLIDATSGEVLFKGENITNITKGPQFVEQRKKMQLIFQDPFASLDPRKCVFDAIAEPLRVHKVYRSAEELKKEVNILMEKVGLAQRLTFSYPHELDGGRRQRIGIARALALKPEFIVCDEPVSALDVSIQAQILNLMQDLQEEMGLTYVFITHDLSVVKHISNDIMVMYLGKVVEKCEADELFEKTLHPYSKALLAAIPIPSVKNRKKRELIRGEVSSPINPKPGCRFAPRCPSATETCFEKTPRLEEVLPGHFVACHYTREINYLV